MSLTVTETDLTNLSATIKTPSGAEEPVGLKKQPNGQLGKSASVNNKAGLVTVKIFSLAAYSFSSGIKIQPVEQLRDVLLCPNLHSSGQNSK